MKIAYRGTLNLSWKNKEKLKTVNQIVDEYRAAGYKLTLRQLYYQLVSRGIIPNLITEYAKLGRLLVKGRMSGHVDWEAIEDRIRTLRIPYFCDGVKDALEDTIGHYRLDRQEGQDNYIEVWVEKDALSGVLSRVTEHYHIRLMVNRGYSSCTAMHDAFQRFRRASNNSQSPNIIYLGDHDPSGLDMIRDIQDRLEEFGVGLEVKHLAITMDQIEQYNPPPNPAKITDPRAEWYINEHGGVSWEVDAIEPKILHKLLTDEIESLVDMETFQGMLDREDEDKERLSVIAEDEE